HQHQLRLVPRFKQCPLAPCKAPTFRGSPSHSSESFEHDNPGSKSGRCDRTWRRSRHRLR
ncbi:hypothetical protein DIJ61_08185, partial [Burkholderia pseudomallei]